jgi:hypothetical protein
MPVALVADLAINVVASPEKLTVPLSLNVVNSGLNDFADLSIIVTRGLADAVESPYRLLGLKIEMDDGAGLRILKKSELGPKVELRASLDGVGRTLTFTRFGADLAPTVSDILRGQRRIRVTGFLGVDPAAMQPRLLFDGYLRSTTPWSAFPPVATIEAQDASIRYAEKQLVLNIPEGSGRTRIDVLQQVQNSYAIPAGSSDLGGNGGGTVNKSIAIGADQNVIDWIRSFVAPLGRRVRFNQLGQMEVGLFAETALPVRALRAGDVANLTMTSPATNDADEVSVNGTAVTLVSTTDGDESVTDGTISTRITTSEQLTTGEYLPQSAIRIQHHVDGVIVDRVFLPNSRETITERVSTRLTVQRFPLNLVRVTEIVDTYGWYAQRACQFRRGGDGSISFNNTFDVYLFADGSARGVTDETFQLLSRQTSTFDYVNGVLVESIVNVGKVAPTVLPATAFAAAFVSAEGESWTDGHEEFFEQYLNTRTQYFLATDRVHLRQIFQTIVSQNGQGFSGFTYQNVGDDASGQLAETFRSSRFAKEIATASQATTAPQSLTGVATDKVRVALSTLITAYQQNDFCENIGELSAAALYALRDLSKLRVEFDMPVDLTMEDGSVFTLPVPKIGSGDYPFVVGEIAWSFDGATGENSQHVTGWGYPKNLPVV